MIIEIILVFLVFLILIGGRIFLGLRLARLVGDKLRRKRSMKYNLLLDSIFFLAFIIFAVYKIAIGQNLFGYALLICTILILMLAINDYVFPRYPKV